MNIPNLPLNPSKQELITYSKEITDIAAQQYKTVTVLCEKIGAMNTLAHQLGETIAELIDAHDKGDQEGLKVYLSKLSAQRTVYRMMKVH